MLFAVTKVPVSAALHLTPTVELPRALLPGNLKGLDLQGKPSVQKPSVSTHSSRYLVVSTEGKNKTVQ